MQKRDVLEAVSAEEVAQQLGRRSPFDRMDPEHVLWLARKLCLEHYPQGSAILKPGEESGKLFFIRAGQVQLEAMGEAIEGSKVLAELVEGECFPLEALHEKRPVFSTFRAKADTWCYELSQESFRELQTLSSTFNDFCRHRAASFLENSRRIFHSHFAQTSPDQLTLSAPISLLMRPQPATCRPADTLRSALGVMDGNGGASVVVVDERMRPQGLLTSADVLRHLARGEFSLDRPVMDVAGPTPPMLPPHVQGQEAALAMAEHGCQDVLVVEDGRLTGTISERELFALQRVGVAEIAGRIRKAQDLANLKKLAQDIHLLAHNLLLQGVSAEQLTRIISTLNDKLVVRVIDLVVSTSGVSDIRFAWLAFGSQGRLEQTFASDQDNGIVFDADNSEATRLRLLPVAKRINYALAECGFPLCSGNIMASNPDWCLSLPEWKTKFAQWLACPEPEALLNATIFFDFRPLWGETSVGDDLAEWLAKAAPSRRAFLNSLANNGLQRTPPVGFFRDFIVDQDKEYPNTLDLKLSGITLFVDAARVLALSTGIKPGSTVERLRAAGEALKMAPPEVEAWIEAFQFIQTLRLQHQHELHRRGETIHNRIDPYGLNGLDRKFFLESLRQAGKLQKWVGMHFRLGTGL